MLLIRRNFDIMRSNCGLVLIRIIESLDVIEITDVKGCNVVSGCQSEIVEAAVLTDVGTVMKKVIRYHLPL